MPRPIPRLPPVTSATLRRSGTAGSSTLDQLEPKRALRVLVKLVERKAATHQTNARGGGAVAEGAAERAPLGAPRARRIRQDARVGEQHPPETNGVHLTGPNVVLGDLRQI